MTTEQLTPEEEAELEALFAPQQRPQLVGQWQLELGARIELHRVEAMAAEEGLALAESSVSDGSSGPPAVLGAVNSEPAAVNSRSGAVNSGSGAVNLRSGRRGRRPLLLVGVAVLLAGLALVLTTGRDHPMSIETADPGPQPSDRQRPPPDLESPPPDPVTLAPDLATLPPAQLPISRTEPTDAAVRPGSDEFHDLPSPRPQDSPITSTTVPSPGPVALPVEIVGGPRVGLVKETSFSFDYDTNGACSTPSFVAVETDTGLEVERWQGETVCVETHFLASAFGSDYQRQTTYTITVTITGADSNGDAPSGLGSASAGFEVTTGG